MRHFASGAVACRCIPRRPSIQAIGLALLLSGSRTADAWHQHVELIVQARKMSVRCARRSGGGLVLLGMAFSVAAQLVGDPGAQELLRQKERERVLREQQESRPDVRLESCQGEKG